LTLLGFGAPMLKTSASFSWVSAKNSASPRAVADGQAGLVQARRRRADVGGQGQLTVGVLEVGAEVVVGATAVEAAALQPQGVLPAEQRQPLLLEGVVGVEHRLALGIPYPHRGVTVAGHLENQAAVGAARRRGSLPAGRRRNG
jgi:hypothetical protein